MSTTLKAWLKQTIAELEEERDATPGAVNEDAAMALEAMKRALASLMADPVAWTDEQELRDVEKYGCGYLFTANPITPNADPHRVIKLYTASPAPMLPEEMPKGLAGQIVSLLAHNIGDKLLAQKIWNACRAAMLQGGEHVTTAYKLPEETSSSLQLRNLIRQRHAEWSQATFGDVGPVGPLKHLSKEALEAAEEPDDLSEWADMQFLLWDAQRRAGISDGEITAAMEEKLKVNMARQWPEPKNGEPRLHIKAAPQDEVKKCT
ncbi:DUF550 domain-containing protein [Enterobacter hormaechei]|nr:MULTISPECIES: DUF550 domain-containing protein [Enterobacter cloacae complex]MCF2273272.1 DUF550 domain-containing protein [Enterobacter hormaechei]KLW67999.1 phage protein Eaa [Enterobacter sp. BIDMC87]MCF2417253.1 DUF550 domain-containing protein [Enterobacter hormaechei]MDR9927221.1 DUF550 domain-containing protein [Enterobacter hormaechei subsp. xiangfangensis]MDR9994872.1 DUF550 domain-containing protein [Enterobacter hormaechei subsp. xiangfangensis]